MAEISQEKIAWVSGRLYGLCGTVRYEVPDGLRVELKNLAALLAGQEVGTEFPQFK